MANAVDGCDREQFDRRQLKTILGHAFERERPDSMFNAGEALFHLHAPLLVKIFGPLFLSDEVQVRARHAIWLLTVLDEVLLPGDKPVCDAGALTPVLSVLE